VSSVQAVELLDVSAVRDNGSKALILLARSLKWNVFQRHNSPVVITAHDGTQRRIPSDSGLRIGVFQGHLSAIISHSEEFTPTIELMDHIIQVVKPNTDQARRMRLAMGESPQQHRERMSAHDAGAAEERDRELTSRVELTDEQLRMLEQVQEAEEAAEAAREEFEMAEEVEEATHPVGIAQIVSSGPARARTANGWSYDSKIALRREWSDGTVDFICQAPGCDYTHRSLLGVSGHWKWHVKRGEVDPSGHAPRSTEDGLIPPDKAAEKVVTRRSARMILDDVRTLVGMDDSKLQAENDRLKAEVARLREENRTLTADWEALQDLLGRKKK
jgi:hypothetical protein